MGQGHKSGTQVCQDTREPKHVQVIFNSRIERRLYLDFIFMSIKNITDTDILCFTTFWKNKLV